MVPTIFFFFREEDGGAGCFCDFLPISENHHFSFSNYLELFCRFFRKSGLGSTEPFTILRPANGPPPPQQGFEPFCCRFFDTCTIYFYGVCFLVLNNSFSNDTLNIFFFGWLLVLVVLVDDLGLWFVASGLDTFFFLLEKNPLFKEKQRIPNNTKFFFRFLTEKPLLDWL